MNSLFRRVLIIILLSLIAVIVHGYEFGVSDQEIVIPYILKASDPSLFPTDKLFQQSSAHLSVFYTIYGQLIKVVDIQLVFLISYFIFQALFFVSLFYLAKVFFPKDSIAYLSLFPFISPKFIGGTANYTFDTFFSYRNIGVTLFTMFLGLLLRRHFILATIVATATIWIHPVSTIPHLILIPTFILFQSRQRIRDFCICSGIFIVITAPLFFLFQKSSISSLPATNFPFWIDVIRSRDSYLFPLLWNTQGWLSLGFFIGTIVLLFSKLNKTKLGVILILTCSFVVFLINLSLLEIFKVPFFAQFQLVRSVNSLAFIALVISPYFLFQKGKLLAVMGCGAFLCIVFNLFQLFLLFAILYGIVTIIIRKSNDYSLNYRFSYVLTTILALVLLTLNFQNFQAKVQFPKRSDSWMLMQLWMKEYTPLNATFVSDPYFEGIRVFSERQMLGSIKDGAVVMYDQDYAGYWSDLMNDLSDYRNLEYWDFKNLSEKYEFEYIITEGDHKLEMSPIYTNDQFQIYRLN